MMMMASDTEGIMVTAMVMVSVMVSVIVILFLFRDGDEWRL